MTDEQYQDALSLASRLMTAEPATLAGDMLELLADLICAHEAERFPAMVAGGVMAQARRDAAAIAKLPAEMRARMDADTDWHGYQMQGYRVAPVGRNPEGENARSAVESRSDEHAVGEAEAPEHHRETSTD